MNQVTKFLASLMFLLVLACDSNIEKETALDSKLFFPLKTGYFLQFNVQSTTYTAGPLGVTSQYQKKWLVVESFLNNAQEQSFVLHEFIRNSEEDDWQYQKTWQATVNAFGLVLTEENISYQKLKFPVVIGNTWNVNELNTELEKNIVVSSILDSRLINENVFNQVAEIEYSNETDGIVGNDIQIEWYAYQVGLIETYTEKITYCTNTPACLGQQIIQSGIIESSKLIAYGVEE